MRNVSRVLAGALVLAAASHGTAWANGTKLWNVCGGNQFSTCAAVEVNVTGNHVVMRTWNLSGLNGSYTGTVFTGVGLFNLPANVDLASNPHFAMSGPARPGNTPGLWTLNQNKQIGGGVNLDIVPSIQGINNGIASGCATAGQLPGGRNQLYMNPCNGNMATLTNWVTFEFDVNNTFDPNSVGLLVKGQNGPNGQSTECITYGAGSNCFDTTTHNVVPEPVTLVLLGSGLASMSGVGFLRRRKKGIEG